MTPLSDVAFGVDVARVDAATLAVTRRSLVSGEVRTLILAITEAEWAAWHAPVPPLVQDAFPALTPAEREFVLTGIRQSEWDAHIRVDDEETL